MLTTRLPALAALAGALVAFGYVGAVDPHEAGHYPACPVLRYTGLLCPGCGGLRGVHALVHGDLAGALAANAVVVLTVALLAGSWAVWFARPRLRYQVPRTALWSAAALVVIFTVVRNLPMGAALTP